MEGTVQEQIDITNEMQSAGFNIVNCGSCGTVLVHKLVPFTMKTRDEEYDIKCWACGFESEPCDFPDYLYEGMPEHTDEINAKNTQTLACSSGWTKIESDSDLPEKDVMYEVGNLRKDKPEEESWIRFGGKFSPSYVAYFYAKGEISHFKEVIEEQVPKH